MRTWLKDMRRKHKLTQKDIAKAADVDVTMISKIELGERNPSVDLAKKIAAVLEFPWTKFYDDDEQAASLDVIKRRNDAELSSEIA